jgi:hypothetical protein
MPGERRLRAVEPDGARMASQWQRAPDSLRDSLNADNAPDNRYSSALHRRHFRLLDTDPSTRDRHGAGEPGE